MKKMSFLLFLLSALSTYAWEYNFPTLEDATTYTDKYAPASTPVLISPDGTIYQTGRYDQGVMIGDEWLDNIAASAYITALDTLTKTPKWSVGIQGAAHIKQIIADATGGNIYVAGTFADDIWLGSTDFNVREFAGTSETHEMANTFVARYSNEGVLLDAQILLPVSKADTVLTENPISVIPTALALRDGKLYLSVTYVGGYSVAGYEGYTRLQNIQGNAYPSLGVAAFSFAEGDLTAVERVLDVQADATSTNLGLGPRSICLTASADGIELALFATGKVTLDFKSWTGTKDATTFDFSLKTKPLRTDESGIALVRLTDTGHSQVQLKGGDSESIGYGSYARNTIRHMQYADGKLYLAGDIATPLPFQLDITPKLFTDQFAVCLNAETYETIWAKITGAERMVLGEGEDKSPWYRNTTTATLASSDYVVLGTANFSVNKMGLLSDYSSDYSLGIFASTNTLALTTKTAEGSKLTVSPLASSPEEDVNPYDLNGDGQLTSSDITQLLQRFVSGDTTFTLSDLRKALNAYLGAE